MKARSRALARMRSTESWAIWQSQWHRSGATGNDELSGYAAGLPVWVLTLERYLWTFAPLTATPYRDGRRIRRSSLRTNVLLRARTVVPSRNSDARSVMLRIPLPEDDGFALVVQMGCFARETRKLFAKGQSDKRDQETKG